MIVWRKDVSNNQRVQEFSFQKLTIWSLKVNCTRSPAMADVIKSWSPGGGPAKIVVIDLVPVFVPDHAPAVADYLM